MDQGYESDVECKESGDKEYHNGNKSEIKPFFVGIAGGSASGKTEIAELIKKKLGSPVISHDWYYKPLEDKSQGPSHNWDDPNSFDNDSFLESMQDWKRGKSVWTPRHDYSKYEKILNVEKIDASPVMIFEGILILHDERIRKMFDLIVFVDCDADTCLIRRLFRDTQKRGYNEKEIAIRYQEHVKPSFDKYIVPTKRYANTIIPNGCQDNMVNASINVEMICSYVNTKIASIV